MSRRKWFSLTAALVAVLALIGLGGAANAYFPATLNSAPPAGNAGAQQTAPQAQVDCSQIKALGLDKQMNLRAAQIRMACGQEQPGDAAQLQAGAPSLPQANRPFAYGGADVNTILPDGTYPKVTQSESFVWGNGQNIVVNYNDSRTSSGCYAGISYSTDGGVTWTRPGGTGNSPLCTGHGTNFGDPTVVWNARFNLWYATDLATGCGGQGLGGWISTDNGATWPASACVHNGGSDDRNSFWVDNTAASPGYGNMYETWNDFNVGGGALFSVRSTDGGATWGTPVQVAPGTPFHRDVQVTGAPNGNVYLASMDEGGGGLGNRTNWMYRSTDQGVTWSGAAIGAAFPGPGVAVSGYFAMMFPTIWRHMGWGEPAVGPNGTVHYVYAQHGAGADAGDVYYTRSTDSGATWSAPLKLNTDSTTRPQWQPSLAANASGVIFAGWYDGRNAASCGNPGANSPCYERWGRASTDGGATWQPDQSVSDVISPLPAQPDSAVQAVYEGDYDYSSADGNNFYQTWTDGRVILGGNSQQDVFFDKIPLIQGTPTPTVTGTPPTNTPTRTFTITPTPSPTACGSSSNYTFTTATATIDAGSVDSGNHGDDVVTNIALPFPVTFYGTVYNAANISSNGNLQFVSNNAAFTNPCLPDATSNMLVSPHWDDLRTDANTGCSAFTSGCGVYTSVVGPAGSRVFNIEWRAVYFASAGTSVNFEIRFYENSLTNRIDFVYGAGVSATSATIGLQKDTGSLFVQYLCNSGAVASGLQIIWQQPPCFSPTPTVTGTPPTNTPTRTATITQTPTVTPTCGGPGTPGPWATASPYPQTIARYAFAQVGSSFYVISGVSGGTVVNTVRRYDVGTGLWTSLAPIPTGSEAPGAAYYNGKIYVAPGNGVTTFYIYDIAGNSWTTGAAYPGTGYGEAAGAFNGNVYVAGGGLTPGSTSWVYNIAGNSWTAGPALPAPYLLGGYNTVGQYLYLIGSYGATPAGPAGALGSLLNPAARAQAPLANSTASMRIDMSAGTVSSGPTWTMQRADMGLATDGVKLFIIGGDPTGGGYFDGSTEVDEYAVSSWPGGSFALSTPALPGLRQANQAGFSSPGQIWSVGGLTGGLVFSPDVLVRTTGGIPCVGTPTRTSTTGPSPTATPFRSPTPTVCVPTGPTWVAGAPFPTAVTRALGVYFPPNGKFYALGGRYADTAGTNLLNPREYNPATDTWTTKAATFDNDQVNNMAGGMLVMSGTNYIITVGGSNAGATMTSTNLVRLYNPVADTLVVLASDPWPQTPVLGVLPGGYTVVNNKLYVLGGYQLSVGMLDTIWEFDPARAAGSRWLQKTAHLPLARGYLPTAPISNIIYTGGGTDWDPVGMTLVDAPDSFKYNPATDVITTIASLPTAASNTRAVNYNGQLWVLGGGFPTGTNVVQAYNPGTNTWTTGPAFVTARRNAAADTDGAGHIYMVGGYATTPSTNMEIYQPAQSCGGATPSATPTRQATATPTATACTIRFTDVDVNNPFYVFIRCLACRQIVSGYSDGTFRWGNSVTRGQLSKIISGASGEADVIPSTRQTFEDVPNSNPFWIWIERLSLHGAISGYTCGSAGEPCVPPGNRPYFRWSANATRGQISKIDAVAAGYADVIPTTQQTFQDVPSSNPFWYWIEELGTRTIISGYNCGGAGEPCIPPGNKPYFRWGADATRGQMSKIAANTFFPNCQTPARPVAPSAPSAPAPNQ